MNPEQNVFTSFNGFEVGDTVMFTPGFTPRYGGNGVEIPTSVIVQACKNKNTKITDLRVFNSEEYEAHLDTIDAWVPIKYLTEVETPENNYSQTIGDKNDSKTKKLAELLESLNDPKYEGIISAIRTGVLNDFLTDIVEALYDDDTTDDGKTDYEFIMGKSIATKTAMVKFVKRHNPDFDPDIAEAFLTKCKPYNIRGDVAFCQSIIETGWFKFIGSSVKPEQHNYCGLGATGGGVAGCSFDTIEKGVEAQIQHLFAYACKLDVPSGRTLYDPRFKYVARGIAPRWVDLNLRWCTGSDYGEKILEIYRKALI